MTTHIVETKSLEAIRGKHWFRLLLPFPALDMNKTTAVVCSVEMGDVKSYRNQYVTINHGSSTVMHQRELCSTTGT